MNPVKHSRLLQLAIGLFTGNLHLDTNSKHRCPKCFTEVSSPIADNFVLYIENLEDYRKNCEMQATQCRSLLKSASLEGTAAALQTQLTQVELTLRILATTTLEERLRPELIGPEERHRLATQSGASLGEVDDMLNGFAQVRDFYRDFRAGTYARYATPWWFDASMIVPILAAIGAGIWGAFSPVVASVLSYLGYSLVCALILLIASDLARRVIAFRRGTSWWRQFGLLMISSGAAGAGLFVLIHDWVVQAGYGLLPMVLGCAALVAVLFWGVGQIVTGLYVRKLQHEIKAETDRQIAERAASSSPVQ